MTHRLLIDLLLILTVAWLFGYGFSRFGLPFILGELVAGLILGPQVLNWVSSSPALELMAQLGLFFAMFYAGIEMDPREALENFWSSMAAAVGGFVVPFGLGFLTARLFGNTVFQSLFLALCVSVTAVAVQSIVLKSLRLNRSRIGHIIIGAAIMTDIFVLVGLSVLLGIATQGSVDLISLLRLLGLNALFFGTTILFGEYVLPRLTQRLTDEAAKGTTFALTVALTLALCAELSGLHFVIGAFLAGQFVRREIMDEKIYAAISDRFYGLSYGFLVPIFFATLSFNLDFQWTWSFWAFTLLLTLAGAVGKVFGAGLGARIMGHGAGEALVIGVGMNGRGTVELVVASVVMGASKGLLEAGSVSEPLLTTGHFSSLVTMVFLTTFLAPVAMKQAVRRFCTKEDYVELCQNMDPGDGAVKQAGPV